MLKKYKHSGTVLSAKQMQQLQGGYVTETDQSPECIRDSQCGHVACDPVEETRWVCQGAECYMLYC